MECLTDISILVIDDEESICELIKRFLELSGYSVLTALDAESGLEVMKKNDVDLVIVDLMMPGEGGLEFTRKAKETKKNVEIVVISGYATVTTAVDAIKLGAFDFIEKPLKFEKLRVIVENALKKGSLENRINYLEMKMKGDVEFSSLVGRNKAFLKTVAMAKQISSSIVNLLVSGESGTGKEAFVRAIHYSGPRSEGPFVAINCAAIPETLLESEFFGHEKGAFTGADSRRKGHFESAEGGTLFLDEVNELPLSLQAKVLRAIQEKQVTRLGSSKPVNIDCRIISATNRNLEEEMKEGRFREDLFYRLNVVELPLPPLRERDSDIPLLAEHFLKKYNGNGIKIEKEAMDVLTGYHWPGNIRELENVLQRAIVLATDKRIVSSSLPEKLLHAKFLYNNSTGISKFVDYKSAITEFEKNLIHDILSINKGNVVKSAEQMEITRQTLHRMMNKHGFSSHTFK